MMAHLSGGDRTAMIFFGIFCGFVLVVAVVLAVRDAIELERRRRDSVRDRRNRQAGPLTPRELE